ncbi:MAG: endonuclease NucS [Syntrophorhabdaceae bacterium]|nr:endonuclease NucS [Syntrophorhabdaceae bacterium]MDD5242833.1 endonuclease NucS [Syntrophorhabdaceae bacterium]
MAITMRLWKIQGNKLNVCASGKLDREDRLEDWIVRDSSLLGLNVLIFGRQVQTGFGGRIDLLAIDQTGNLIIIELKKDKTPRDIVSQVLDYATWVKELNLSQVEAIANEFLTTGLEVTFREHFGIDLPETINTEQRMVIVASEIDAASERIVQYLSDKFGVDINVVFFTYFKNDNEELLGRSWLIDPQIIEDKTESRRKGPWSGFWYVNIDENWEDCRQHGFVSAGGGKKYSDPLQKLKIGDKIFAYLKGSGYVGYGEVVKEVVSVAEFIDGKTNKALLSLQLKESPQFEKNLNDPERLDYLVGTKWIKSFPKSEAKSFKGAFANQNIVCKLRDEKTLDFLNQKFDVKTE